MATDVIVSGAVLAGGASRRMGQDKAFIEIDGVSMLDGAVRALTDAGTDPVIVVGGDQARVEAAGHRYVADRHPGEGPLGGVITALTEQETDLVVVLACDLIAASPVAVSTMIGTIGDADVAVPVVDGQAQWLHAVWRRSALPRLQQAFDSGERAPRRAVAGLALIEILDGAPCWYADADAPSDLPVVQD